MKSAIKRPRRLAAVVLTISTAAALSLTACASDEEAGKTASGATGKTLGRFDTALYEKAVQAAKTISGGEKLDKSIEYLGVNGGAEGDVLKGVYKAFTDATGTAVNYTGSQDLNNIVQSRVSAGNAPDVVDQSLGPARQYAKQGKLMNLSDAIGNDTLKTSYSDSLLTGASEDGKVFGVYQGFNNFMVWYNPQQYKGPKNPSTWEELAKYTDEQAAQGKQTWCIAEEAGGASGFPGAQFIENIFAKKYGPEKLRQWGLGELKWTSPEVKDAFQEFGKIATDDKKVAGGVAGSLAAPIATGYNGLVAEPATCQLALWGAWVPGLIGDDVKPGENIDFFQVPGSTKGFEKTEIFQTTVATAFKDSPTTRAFMKYIASPEAQALLASADQWPVANTQVKADVHSNELLKKATTTFFADDVKLSTGPNVLANSAVSGAFWKAVVTYLQNPSELDSVLQTVQAAQDGS
ncbi:ABC transporter substrate-binding protein [Pseudarthrobacter sp. LMD1-1-1.1]|uniref:ABC transporter substrate-binding protein n=1 Tax=Pseudarthrobacter sp. LMD1-1-1.1 TaxID=3135242 RepID=UPI00343B5F88